jgi:hypothetical protein
MAVPVATPRLAPIAKPAKARVRVETTSLKMVPF